MDRRPIGVFDSGVGGLTVVRELIKRLPGENIVYFGDTARVPYGTKSHKTIIKFSIESLLFLLRHNVKIVVVACNTSSSVALPTLKKSFKVPIIGVIKPGADEAITSTRNRRVGVIGTTATVKSRAYEKEIIKSSPSAKVFSISCPLFVPLVEEGWLDGPLTRHIVRHHILPLKTKGIDVLILGCTHYPLLKKSIQKTMGKDVALIDSAVSTAKVVERLLLEQGILNDGNSKSTHKFFVSDEPERLKTIGEKFLGQRLTFVRKIKDAL